jgi:uncharacterized protein YndB with AHSA1/START domain
MELTRSVTLPVPPERAFALWTTELGAWWPREYTWSQGALEHIAIEPREGGRAFERGPRGFECDWGRVLVCEPLRRLAFTWQIAPDRTPQPDDTQASEVELVFAEGDQGTTTLQLVHRGFERHGEGGAGYRDAMASEAGWPFMLGRLAERAR